MWRRFQRLSGIKQVATAGALALGLLMIIAALVGSPGKHNASSNAAQGGSSATVSHSVAATSLAPETTVAVTRSSTTHPAPKPPPKTTQAIVRATTQAAPPPVTHAVVPITHHTTPYPAVSPTQPQSCYPLTHSGNCYEPGEYCRNSDHGMTGIAGDGKRITCEDNNGWRWEPTP